MAKLTDQQKSFFHDMESLFQSPGWGRLTAGWKQEQEQLAQSTFFNAKSMEDVAESRVRYSLLTELLQLPDWTAGQKQTILEDEDHE